MKKNLIVVRPARRPPQKNRVPRRVMVVADLTRPSGRDIFQGVSRYADTRPEWMLSLASTPESLTKARLDDFLAGGGDGVILCTSGVRNERLSRLLLEHDVPLVCIGKPGVLGRRRTRAAFLRIDNRAIGAFGARYLASLGRRRFYGFVFSRNEAWNYWQDECRQGFTAELARTGRRCGTFELAVEADGRASGAALRAWLAPQPKPCAIMAAEDLTALRVIEACRECGVAVPQQVAVLGAGNERTLCEFVRPTLSSVMPGHDRLGEAAARELDALMTARGRVRARTRPRLPPLQIVERESTAAASPAAHLITRALAYIQENAARGIRVPDVVRHLGVSRRLADLRFREFQGKTILDTITDCRLDEVRRRLATTQLSVKAVSRVCGFANETYLKTLFKRRFGLTMRDWRRAHAAGRRTPVT